MVVSDNPTLCDLNPDELRRVIHAAYSLVDDERIHPSLRAMSRRVIRYGRLRGLSALCGDGAHLDADED